MSTAPAKTTVIGLVGYGNMGRALALGLAAQEDLAREFSPLVYESYEPAANAAREAGFALAPDLPSLAAGADFIILAVKPYQAAAALQAMAPALGPEKSLISIAAGVTLDFLARHSQGRCPLVRVMPNTPALAGQGVFGLCFDSGSAPNPAPGSGPNSDPGSINPGSINPGSGPFKPVPRLDEARRAAVRRIFSSLGLLIELNEAKMNAFTALSGSGPGYVFHFMESLAEAGVSVGLDRASSLAVAAALLRGCAAMAEQGQHPALLREQVSSPGGTTLAGLNHLDRSGARGILIDAVRAACERGEEMEKQLLEALS